jgi:hypothetical protein
MRQRIVRVVVGGSLQQMTIGIQQTTIAMQQTTILKKQTMIVM